MPAAAGELRLYAGNPDATAPNYDFASTLPGNLITPAVQRAKLEVLGRLAKEIWR